MKQEFQTIKEKTNNSVQNTNCKEDLITCNICSHQIPTANFFKHKEMCKIKSEIPDSEKINIIQNQIKGIQNTYRHYKNAKKREAEDLDNLLDTQQMNRKNRAFRESEILTENYAKNDYPTNNVRNRSRDEVGNSSP